MVRTNGTTPASQGGWGALLSDDWGMVIVHNLKKRDKGTAFRLKRGKGYYDEIE
jgi:hypothetical protein